MGDRTQTGRCGESVACVCSIPGERPSEKLRASDGLSRLVQPDSSSSVKMQVEGKRDDDSSSAGGQS